MKKQIRRGTFETNSSSVHSITMCELDEYTKWVDGELYLDRWGRGFITLKEYQDGLEEYISENQTYSYNDEYFENSELEDMYKSEFGYVTYDDWIHHFNYENEKNEFTTKNGDTVIALCYYGHD